MKNEEFVACSRASLGIYLILKEFYSEEYVAVPWNVCPDVIFSIILANKKPYFLEYSSKSTPISKKDLKRIPTKVTCLLHVHIYGYFYSITKDMRKRFPLIIDDAAQALGTKHGSLKAGLNGDFGIFSFGNTKQCDLGGGGLVYSKNIKKLKILDDAISRAKLLSRKEFVKFSENNYFYITSKLKLFEKFGSIDWRLPNLNPAVVLKSFDGELKKETLVQYLKTYDPSSRILIIKLFLNQLLKMNLKCDVLGKDDNPWRIVVMPIEEDFNKYIKAFKHLRKEGCKCSNWYYPSNEIFGFELDIEKKVPLKSLCRFQFSIEVFSNTFSVKNADKIIKILRLYYG